MGDLGDIGQKIKGKYQKAKGEMQQNNGNPISGTIEKIKGNLNEGMADSKLRSRRSHHRNNSF